MSISVAETLRQAAYLCSGAPSGIFITIEFLRQLAQELEPDHIEADAEKQATRSGFEAIGRISSWGHLHYFFVPMASFDQSVWDKLYEKGYRINRFPLPAIRPRQRAKAICIRYAPYPLG